MTASIKSIKFQEQTRPFWKAKLVSLADYRHNSATSDGFFPGVYQRLVIEFCEQSHLSILLVVWRLLSWPLASALFPPPLHLYIAMDRWNPGTPMMGAVLAAVAHDFIRSIFGYMCPTLAITTKLTVRLP